MDSQTRLGLELLAAALVLGVLGDLVLRVTPWGLNASLWIGCVVVTGYGLVHRWRASLVRAERWFILPVCALALLFLGRDAALLKLTNAVAVLTALALVVQRAQVARLRQHGGPLHDPPGLLATGGAALLRLPQFLTRGVDWRSLRAEGRGRRAAAVGRGLLLAAPILFFFGILLVAADAIFESLVMRLFDVDAASLPGHLVLTASFAWIVGGVLYGVLMTVTRVPEQEDEVPPARRGFSLGIVEVGLVLGLLNLLFAVFVLVQLPYFFGGYGTVLHTSDLTLAQYARRGFFELVTVAALALPLLMGLRRLLTVQTVRHLRLFHGLAATQVGLLFLILASAAQRMWIYQQTLGLTVLRLYVSAFIVWLAFVLGWFAVTALRERGERFVPGAAVAGLALVLGLHALNPDALIVRTNVARAAEGKRFDVVYMTRLSADAVPALLEALPALRPEERMAGAAWLLTHWYGASREDWRTWSRARAAARRTVQAEAATLRKIVEHAPAPPYEAAPVARGTPAVSASSLPR